MAYSTKLLIPIYAKKAAKRALSIRKQSKTQTKKASIISGANQAKFIISNKYLTKAKARQFYKFYQRFKNCRTKKCDMAMALWGGRKFLKTKVFRFVKRNAKRKKRYKKR